MNKFIVSVFTEKGLPYLLCLRQHMMLTADEWQPPAKKQHKIKSNKTLLGTKPRRYYAKDGQDPGSRERITKRITKSRKVPGVRKKGQCHTNHQEGDKERLRQLPPLSLTITPCKVLEDYSINMPRDNLFAIPQKN